MVQALTQEKLPIFCSFLKGNTMQELSNLLESIHWILLMHRMISLTNLFNAR